MELWHLVINKLAGYDSNDSFVVRAHDAINARLMASKQAGDEGADTWINSDKSSCVSIGTAYVDSADVIIQSFNAG